jgi:hypothetical protein
VCLDAALRCEPLCPIPFSSSSYRFLLRASPASSRLSSGTLLRVSHSCFPEPKTQTKPRDTSISLSHTHTLPAPRARILSAEQPCPPLYTTTITPTTDPRGHALTISRLIRHSHHSRWRPKSRYVSIHPEAHAHSINTRGPPGYRDATIAHIQGPLHALVVQGWHPPPAV